MARRRNQRRDRLGRFAGTGTKVASAKSAAKAAPKTGATKVATGVGKSYVSGSFSKNLVVGQGGEYKGVKVGAEFKTPKGRGVLVKGIVGYHGKPDRRVAITPELNLKQKKLSVHATPNPNRRASAGKRLR